MINYRIVWLWSLFLLAPIININAQTAEKAKPFFKDGEAQVVPAFEDPAKWIRHDLWVETTFDSDGDGKPDRMHVAVTRPEQTETEGRSEEHTSELQSRENL